MRTFSSFGLAFLLIFVPNLELNTEDALLEPSKELSFSQAASSNYPFYSEYIRELRQREVVSQEVLATKSLLDIASDSKNVEPFANNNARNAANRFAEWKRSDRTVKKNSSRHYALLKFEDYGWQVEKEWGCLDRLWWHESNWSHKAGDATGRGAYGIPQSAPGSKMAEAGEDWKTNPETQINWGLNYIDKRYGSPCKAFKFWKKQAEHGDKGYGWY